MKNEKTMSLKKSKAIPVLSHKTRHEVIRDPSINAVCCFSNHHAFYCLFISTFQQKKSYSIFFQFH